MALIVRLFYYVTIKTVNYHFAGQIDEPNFLNPTQFIVHVMSMAYLIRGGVRRVSFHKKLSKISNFKRVNNIIVGNWFML